MTTLDQNVDQDQLDQEEEEQDLKQPSRLESLKAKADKLGIKYKSNISETALAKKIDLVLSDESTAKDESDEVDESEQDDEEEEAPKPKKLDKASERKRSQKLVRVIVRPLDPRRTQLDGELVMTGNSAIGTTGKFVPFNVEAGFHIPEIIYNTLKDRTFTEFYTVEDKDGNEHTKSRQKKAFIIEVLDPLTEAEIQEIKIRQQATLQD